MSYETQGTGRDPHAFGYERQGLDSRPAAATSPESAEARLEAVTKWKDQLLLDEKAQRLAREDAEARIEALEEALGEIRELNMTGADENGKRWANSDLIEQAIVFALSWRKKQ